ncbi:GFA family protein [Pseudomonas alkylphenolica]|uniref:GFA family protein n=1 Tax=Pseudomonas TaxID=286 RepID=UPI003391F1F9
MDSHPQYFGSCVCSAVTYRVEGPINAVTHCHCSQCRKAHGAAFASYGSVPAASLTVSDPDAALRVFKSSPTVSRSFCSRCGANLFWSDAAGQFCDWISVALGTLDTPFEPARQQHVHVQSKACWWEINDAWPQHCT